MATDKSDCRPAQHVSPIVCKEGQVGREIADQQCRVPIRVILFVIDGLLWVAIELLGHTGHVAFGRGDKEMSVTIIKGD